MILLLRLCHHHILRATNNAARHLPLKECYRSCLRRDTKLLSWLDFAALAQPIPRKPP